MTPQSKDDEGLDLELLDDILKQFPNPEHGDIIPILQGIQERYGYLDSAVLEETSRRTRLPLNQMCGVATFYAQFSFQPRGKYIVRICRGTACHVRGGKRIRDTATRLLGISDGETTKDLKFSLETVACLGACALSPVMMVGDTYFGKMTPAKAKTILTEYATESGSN